MSTFTPLTEDTEKPAKAGQQPDAVTTFTAGLFTTLGVSALVPWLAGIALHQGFRVSVPFFAGFLLVLTFFFLAKTTANIVASGWYAAVLQVAPRLIAAETATAVVTEREAERLLDDLAFADISAKLENLAAEFPAE